MLAKPAPVRNRKDSSDAEPSPPNSPSYFEEDHVSSITVSLKILLKFHIENYFFNAISAIRKYFLNLKMVISICAKFQGELL